MVMIYSHESARQHRRVSRAVGMLAGIAAVSCCTLAWAQASVAYPARNVTRAWNMWRTNALARIRAQR